MSRDCGFQLQHVRNNHVTWLWLSSLKELLFNKNFFPALLNPIDAACALCTLVQAATMFQDEWQVEWSVWPTSVIRFIVGLYGMAPGYCGETDVFITK
jgi:hypothetical protein